MDRHERKYYNTDRKIHNAFIRLLSRKDFSDISVTALCRIAGVNRSTFYAHYANTHELAEQIQREIVELFFKEMRAKGYFEDETSAYSNSVRFFTDKTLLSEFLGFIMRYKLLYSVISKNHKFFTFKGGRQLLKSELFMPAFSAKGTYDSSELDYLYEFILTGFYAVIDKWVNGGCKEDVTVIAEILSDVFSRLRE